MHPNQSKLRGEQDTWRSQNSNAIFRLAELTRTLLVMTMTIAGLFEFDCFGFHQPLGWDLVADHAHDVTKNATFEPLHDQALAEGVLLHLKKTKNHNVSTWNDDLQHCNYDFHGLNSWGPHRKFKDHASAKAPEFQAGSIHEGPSMFHALDSRKQGIQVPFSSQPGCHHIFSKKICKSTKDMEGPLPHSQGI